jgi:N-methylhydantoinase A/oxoprolinase/acetone carboxylase beta subunit
MVEIGIDTGGTFTDAAAVSTDDDGRITVIGTAKSLTTKGDLSVGVTEALMAVLPTLNGQPVGAITVSTTLATNAVVEGHGDRVGIILIGFDDAMAARLNIGAAFTDCPIKRIDGGHNHAGLETRSLDTESLRHFAKNTHGVKAFAVAGLFGNRNPEHERAAAAVLTEVSNLPVSLSSDLTGALDAPRRAITTILNARLIGKISALITAVEAAATTLGLTCPIMLVKGDGTRASASEVRLRPVETVMSGPAASTIGGAALSGLQSCIMSDVGGTTTDVAILENGRPAVSDDGATVGGWRTLVRAADVRTHALGGDSQVHCDGAAIVLGPQRSVPISLLASRFPEVIKLLRADVADEDIANARQGQFVALPFETSSLPTDLSTEDSELLQRIHQGPLPLSRIASTARNTRRVSDLRNRGLLVLSTLTVSDAAHVLGKQTIWSTEAARLAVQLSARVKLMRTPTDAEIDEHAATILDVAVTRSALAVLDACWPGSIDVTANSRSSNTTQNVAALVASGRPQIGRLTVSMSPSLPVVAVGGPAPLLYPEVGERLGTQIVLLEHGAVANAVGAAIGWVEATITISIEHSDAAYRLVSPTGAASYAELALAMDAAHLKAHAEAEALCRARGASNPAITITEKRTYIPGRTDDNGLLFAEIIATATGRPSVDR